MPRPIAMSGGLVVSLTIVLLAGTAAANVPQNITSQAKGAGSGVVVRSNSHAPQSGRASGARSQPKPSRYANCVENDGITTGPQGQPMRTLVCEDTMTGLIVRRQVPIAQAKAP